MIDVTRLRKLYENTSAREWESDNVQDRGERRAHYTMSDGNGRVIFDTLNSESAEICEESGEDEVWYWDEIARKNFRWIAEVHARFPEILQEITLLRERVAELEELRSDK